MLPNDTKDLLTDTTNDLLRQHITTRDEEIFAFKSKMANQGLSKSSAFEQGLAMIYKKGFDAFAGQVQRGIEDLLTGIAFQPYDGCVDDLATAISDVLQSAYEADSRSIAAEWGSGRLKYTLDLPYQSHK